MKQGELDNARRRALNLFDNWNNTTGFVEEHTGYYYELQGLIEDAVRCGVQAALGVHESLECEEKRVTLKVLTEKDKQEIREALKNWCQAAKATAERDPAFRETLARTPFYGMAMQGEGSCPDCGLRLPCPHHPIWDAF